MSRRMAQFAADCGGTLIGEDRAYVGVSTDTRSIARGELFIGLRGPRFDGAAFVAQAIAAEADGTDQTGCGVAMQKVPGRTESTTVTRALAPSAPCDSRTK